MRFHYTRDEGLPYLWVSQSLLKITQKYEFEEKLVIEKYKFLNETANYCPARFFDSFTQAYYEVRFFQPTLL